MIRVMFFCLGNICRSPLGEALFAHHVAQRGLSDHFLIESSGTSAYHVGEAPDPGSQRVAKQKLNLDLSTQRAQQLTSEHLEHFDYLVAMSHSNIAAARRLKHRSDTQILLLRDFEPDPIHRNLDIPDPWGHGPSAFEDVFNIVHRTTSELLEHIVQVRRLNPQ